MSNLDENLMASKVKKRFDSADGPFKRKVAEEFLKARERALKTGMVKSAEDFVRSLGVTRAGFHKYITKKSIPSLRVLNRARRLYNVRLNYGELGSTYFKGKKADPRQRTFEFVAEAISKEQIEIKKFSPKGETTVELVISIDFSKTA